MSLYIAKGRSGKGYFQYQASIDGKNGKRTNISVSEKRILEEFKEKITKIIMDIKNKMI